MILHHLFICVTVVASAYETLSGSTNCKTTGRFRYSDPTCRNYFLCVHSHGSLIARDYVCPESTIFNPSTSRCSTSAHCIEDICQNLPPLVTKVADPNGTDCKTYIECVGSTSNSHPVVKTCEIGYFNKDLLSCSSIPNC
ncbi:uncharacterized protein LOC123005624 [Tribolium madens]|uniref:uncharacterized protein LOC123005624 n=1 Tax=Tribolium madens TaxID=41895 RepID=UPI001CF73FB0|nr:uncharacterized protein LOC123005624 [Tribolium madens]